MKIIFATNNPGKFKEINELFAQSGLAVCSPRDVNVAFDGVETGHTFADNAVQKAEQCAALCGDDCVVLADDSGLCVDALDGEPGVYSARWLGEHTPYSQKNQRILDLLKDVPDEKRGARFVCVIAAVWSGGRVLTTQGTLEGRIAHQPDGTNGFGYDPIFFVPEAQKTSAQLTMEEKNRISHRGKALRAMLALLQNER
jgi:XTP/dITP diphosphohydrolase